MDKVMSTRIDEAVAARIDALARRLGTSKKRVIEEAIRMYAYDVEAQHDTDTLRETFGAWKREEKAEHLVEQARTTFRESMNRRHK